MVCSFAKETLLSELLTKILKIFHSSIPKNDSSDNVKQSLRDDFAAAKEF